MEDFIKIGVIVKPQGIKGEVKVIPLTDDAGRYKILKQVYIDGKLYKVHSAKIASSFVILSLEGVFDRNSAELLRGLELFVLRKDAISLPENTFFIADVLGCEFFSDSGYYYGRVTDVLKLKTDVWTVVGEKGVMRFPFLKDLLVSVDLENKKIVASEKRLKEVSCYED